MPSSQFTIADIMDILITKAGLPRDAATEDPSATFDAMGLDSLAYLQLQAEISDRYGFELPDMSTEDTLGEIIAAINDGLREDVHR